MGRNWTYVGPKQANLGPMTIDTCVRSMIDIVLFLPSIAKRCNFFILALLKNYLHK
jgi:hypothetical protein